MPSPLGHALAGMAAGWTVAPSSADGPAFTRRLTACCALAAMLPDLDLLGPVHRGPAHSLAAALVAGGLAWAGIRALGEGKARAARLATAIAAAYATHILLDWLGADSSPPIGIMALWPVSHAFYASASPVFPAISRQYWLRDFWGVTLRAVAWELAVLVPVALLAWKGADQRGPEDRTGREPGERNGRDANGPEAYGREADG